MSFDPTIHHRRSIRLPGFDYSSAGAYFVTICAQNRACRFGAISGGRTQPNDAGRMIRSVWDSLADPTNGVELDEFVVMPNHVHGILVIRSAWRAENNSPVVGPRRPNGTSTGTLGRIIQAFKSNTARQYIAGVHEHGWPRFSGHLWQRDYFEHIIRNDDSLDRIREYIRTNPERWTEDADNPTGTASDHVQGWVRALNMATADSGGEEDEHEVRPDEKNDAGSSNPRRLGTGGRTQGSPLRETVTSDARANTRFAPTNFRVGHGYDLHRLRPGGRLLLGGVEVSRDLSPVAHSDGDVALHALVDALLGAMGWGDIGEHFPNTDDRWKDAPSRVFVEEVYAKVAAAGYRVGNADVTILAERPKLKPFKGEMGQHVAGLLGVDPSQVNVKAGTNEGCDAIGRGEAIAAHVVVLLVAADSLESDSGT